MSGSEREFMAHTPNSRGKRHFLHDHLTAVAALTRDYSAKFAAGEIGYQLGLWHDIGKFNPQFQDYLHRCYEAESSGRSVSRKGPAHSPAGASWARKSGWGFFGFALLGHHGGLPSGTDLRLSLGKSEKDQTATEVMAAAEGYFTCKPERGLNEILPSHVGQKRSAEFFLRMLFSALVDADYLDTEVHFNADKADLRAGFTSLPELADRFERSQAALRANAGATPVNGVREDIFECCVERAGDQQGIFRLTAPTGSGKTRSALAFALGHARTHDLDRVITALPYTSITEQTSEVYRSILDEEDVLEHHSGMQYSDDSENPDLRGRRMQLASENWDVPVVVTTTVQLFESLFSHKPSKCRKLHNLANSVIILDEVQALPERLLGPILDVIQELVDHYGVTVLLCTATQPAFESGSEYLKGLREVKEVVPEPARHFRALSRVEYVVKQEPWSWARLAEEMSRHSQCMVVLNRKKDALYTLDALNGAEGVLHLSTFLCGQHRREVIREIRRRLASGEPCRLVATQVVEAGVDIDFPAVFRAMGPLDRIVQAAGRCNREGNLAKGRMVVFEPEEGGIPRGSYRSGTEEARTLLSDPNVDFDDPELYRTYFRRLYQDVDTHGRRIQELRDSFDFPEVSREFRMIPDNTIPVLVPYGEEAGALLDKVEAEGVDRGVWRRLQPYVVNFYENQMARLRTAGLVAETVPGLHKWLGRYDPICGVGREEADPTQFMG